MVKYGDYVMASEIVDLCGLKMDKIYKSSKVCTEKFGKKLIINIKVKTGDPYLDAAINLGTPLRSMYPFSEICARECLSRKQEEALKNSKFVARFQGVHVFYIPSKILDNVPFPTICFTSTDPRLGEQSPENTYLEVVKACDSVWICAY